MRKRGDQERRKDKVVQMLEAAGHPLKLPKLREAIATNIILLTQLVAEGRVRRLPGGFYAAPNLPEPADPLAVARKVIDGTPHGWVNVGAMGAAGLSRQVLADLVEQGLLLANRRHRAYRLPPVAIVPALDPVAAVHAVFQQRPDSSVNTVPLHRLQAAGIDGAMVERLVREGVLWFRRGRYGLGTGRFGLDAQGHPISSRAWLRRVMEEAGRPISEDELSSRGINYAMVLRAQKEGFIVRVGTGWHVSPIPAKPQERSGRMTAARRKDAVLELLGQADAPVRKAALCPLLGGQHHLLTELINEGRIRRVDWGWYVASAPEQADLPA
ncbi:MAG: hypothetical protein FD119_125 [Stygiobacter sp.]|nr:MAG: hypothetical protein FD119_125 [Stygiobacter sp.]